MSKTVAEPGYVTGGVWVPPTKHYNIYINDVRVWSGDEWPAFGIVDTAQRIAWHNDLKFEFLLADGSSFSY